MTRVAEKYRIYIVQDQEVPTTFQIDGLHEATQYTIKRDLSDVEMQVTTALNYYITEFWVDIRSVH